MLKSINILIKINRVSFFGIFCIGLITLYGCRDRPCHEGAIPVSDDVDFIVRDWKNIDLGKDIDERHKLSRKRETMVCDLVNNVLKPLASIDSVNNLLGPSEEVYTACIELEYRWLTKSEFRKEPYYFLYYHCGESASGDNKISLVFNSQKMLIGFRRCTAT